MATTSAKTPASRRIATRGEAARDRLDAWVREVVAWHFDPKHGDALLARLGEAGWLRPAPGRQGLRRPRPLRLLPGRVAARRPGAPLGAEGLRREARSRSSRPAARPACRSRASTSTTSASTTRCSATRCPRAFFPKGADWLHVGPSGPRRLRLAVEHLCQHRGGICFMVDLDPRWVIKLVKRGDIGEMERYKQHVVDQALTLLKAHDGIRCMFTTPKLLEALCEKVSLEEARHHRRLLRRHRDDAAVPPLRGRGAARGPRSTSRRPTATR